jgi:pimeloyl-ACP methyl ester carboxylesterase
VHDQPALGDPARRSLTIAGRTIDATELSGDPARAALVLLHEGLGSVGLWRGFPAALQRATGRRVIVFSRFGHGRSAPPLTRRPPALFHVGEALEVLPRVLDEFDAPEPVLVGHSDGGSIALIHAGRHRVAGLALLAPHVVVEAITLAAIRKTREAYLDGDLRERMARHHDDPDAAFWGWCDMWLDPEFQTWNLEPDAARVTAPTLLIQGADDPYGTLDQLDRIEARMRGPVRRLIVPGGHRPHREQPEAVVGAIAAFVDGLP